MSVPFRIPKKKQPSDACSLDMQSPLSRLQDSSSPKMQWGSGTHNGRASHKFSLTNGKTFSKHSQRGETIRSPEAHALKGTVRGKISFTLNKQPIKISPARVNGMPHKVSETGSSRAKCQTPTTGRDFIGNNRWRPKRASDTLCRDEYHMGDFESPSFKIRRDSGETETSEFFREEEDIEGTQGPSRVTETQRPSNVKEVHISKTEVSPVESTPKQGKNGSVSNEESTFKPSNHESRSERHVQEEQPCLMNSGEKANLPRPVRKDPLVSPSSSKSEDPFKSFYKNRLSGRPRLFYKTYKRAKPSSTEPIVLSSDDDGSDEVNDTPGSSREQLDSGAVGDTQGNKKSPKANTGSQKTTSKVEVPSIMELPFSTLHYDTGEAQSNGTVVITDDGISIPLKGADGESDIALSVTCAQLLLYGLWDGGLARDGSLLPNTEEPAPSLLFLIVSDAQARLIQKELSVIHSVHTSGQACPFVLLVLADQLGDLQAAMLASLMDLIGLKHGQRPLSNPLSWPDGLNRLHCHRQGVHLLSLLGQNVDDGHDTALKSAGGTGSCHGEPTVRRPLRSHSRPQSLPRSTPSPSKGGITVTTEDLECLKDGEFLNDVIIDFYLKYLLLETADEDVAERSHVFSSFFYKQLTRKDSSCPEETGRTAQHRRHHRVRTWTRHVDIFSKDYLFIPVNQEAHWYLVVICFPGLERPQCVEWRGQAASQTADQTVNVSSAGENQTGSLHQSKSNSLNPSGMRKLPDCTVRNCTREKVCRRPCILVMDSLKLSYHHRIYTLLREYLQVEWEVRKQTPRAFKNENIGGYLCRVPLQDNSSDCGLYLLQYVESFLENPVVHFELPLRLDHWFPRNQVRRKREELRELVLQLYRRQEGGAEQNVQ